MRRIVLFLFAIPLLALPPVYVRFGGYGTGDFNSPLWLENDDRWSKIGAKRMFFGPANRAVMVEYADGPGYAAYYYNPDKFSGDQYAQATAQIENFWGDLQGPAVGVRLSDTGGYLCVQGYSNSSIVSLPSGTILAQSKTIGSGIFTMRCEASGSTITMKVNGAVSVTAKDTSYAAGSPGLGGGSLANPTRSGSLWDWTAGNLPEPASVVTTTALMEQGTVGRPYRAKAVGAGGDGNYAWSVLSGSLPAGLSLDSSSGLISGTPAEAGVRTFTLRVTSGGANGDQPLSITIRPNSGSILFDDYAGPIRTLRSNGELYMPVASADSHPVKGRLMQEANTLRFDWKPDGCDVPGNWTKDCGPYFWTFPGPPYTDPTGFTSYWRAEGAWDANVNRMTLRLKCDRDVAARDIGKQAMHIGTYVKSHSDSANPNNQEGGGHLYHYFLFATPANRWVNLTLNRVPQHVRGWTYTTEHHDEEIRENFVPGIIPDAGNYLDVMTSFYRTIWVDSNSDWLTCHYSDHRFGTVLREPDFWVASTAAYYTGSRYEAAWSAPEPASYIVRYSASGSLKTSGFSSGTSGGSLTAGGRGHVVWHSPDMPEGQNGVWAGIRPIIPVSKATNASPIRLTLHGHGLQNGDEIRCSGVEGNTAANGAWTVTVVDQDTVALGSSTGNGAYTSGGTCTATSDTANFTEVFIPKDASVAPPSNLSAQVAGLAMALSWTNGEAYTRAHVERRTADTFWREVAALEGNVASWSDTSVKEGVTYYYRVRGWRQIYSPFTAAGSATYSKPMALTIISLSLPDGRIGVPYSQAIATLNGVPPLTWAVTAGSLPAGLSLTDGTISGIPAQEQTSGFTLQVTGKNTQTATRAFSIKIGAAPAAPVLATTDAPAGRASIPYSLDLNATGGTAPYAWSVTAGSLPPGLTLTGNTISGTPTQEGSFRFTLTVTDAWLQRASKHLAIVIGPAPVLVRTPQFKASVSDYATGKLAGQGSWIDAGLGGYNGLYVFNIGGIKRIASAANQSLAKNATPLANDQYATATLVKDTDKGGGGVVVRASESGLYACYLALDGKITMYKLTSWGSAMMGNSVVAFNSGDTIRLEAQGPNLSCFHNQDRMIWAADNSQTAGVSGIYHQFEAWNANGITYFEAGNIVMQDLPAATSAPRPTGMPPLQRSH